MCVRSATSAGMSFVNADSATPSGPHSVASGSAAPRSLNSWTRVVGGDAAEEHGVRAGVSDLRRKRPVVRRLRVDRVRADDLDAVQLGRVGRRLGDTRAVHLLVVEDVQLLDALLGHPLGLRRSLDVVGGHDAPVGAVARRVVLLRRALVVRAGVLRQLERGVRRADLQEARLVGDRNRDRRGARVELADQRDRVVVVRRPCARSPRSRPDPTCRPAPWSRRASCTRRCMRPPWRRAARARAPRPSGRRGSCLESRPAAGGSNRSLRPCSRWSRHRLRHRHRHRPRKRLRQAQALREGRRESTVLAKCPS